MDLTLAPDETRTLAFVLAFAPTGEADAIATYRPARMSG